MALRSAFESALRGDWKNAANYLFIDQETVDTFTTNQNQLENRIVKSAQDGLVPQEKANALLADMQRNAYPFIFNEFGPPPADVFAQGIAKDTSSIISVAGDFVNKTVGGAGKFVFKAIPWYVWLIAVVALLVYLAPFLKTLSFLKRK